MIQFPIIAVLALFTCAAQPSTSAPPPGQPGPFTVTHAAAGKAGAKGDRLFVVFVVRPFDPGSQTNEEFWRDARVSTWVKEHGAAMRYEAPGDSAALKEFDCFAPAVLAFRDGVEVDRDTTFQSADELLEWLGRLASGTVDAEYAHRRATIRPDDSASTLTLALRHQRAGRLAEAADAYLQVWPRLVERTDGFRRAWIIARVREIAATDAAVLPRVAAMRDRAEADLAASEEAVSAWLDLHEIVPDVGRLIAWYERTSDMREWTATREAVQLRLLMMLFVRGAAADVGRLIKDPAAMIRHEARGLALLGVLTDAPQDPRQSPRYRAEEAKFAAFSAMYYASLLAAGRDAEASAAAAQIIETADTPVSRLILVETALYADQPRPEHLVWAEAADREHPQSPSLKQRVEDRLRAKQK